MNPFFTVRPLMVLLLISFISINLGSSASAQNVYGAIAEKYKALGGERSALGRATSDESAAPHGGRFNSFQHGYIYWHPKIGAFAVWGQIAEKWNALGRVEYGYPITDELVTPDGRGRFNHFRAIHRGGRPPEASIYWTPQTGPRAIWGSIRDAWASQGWERGELGYPTSDEFQEGQFRRANFQNGFILWSAKAGAAINTPSRIARCNGYADQAQRQVNEMVTLKCGATGNRWTFDRQAHFIYCINEFGNADREARERDGLLSRCRTTNPASKAGCSYSVEVSSATCFDGGNRPQSLPQSGTYRAMGCGASQFEALSAAKGKLKDVALTETPTANACTYTSQTFQGCRC